MYMHTCVYIYHYLKQFTHNFPHQSQKNQVIIIITNVWPSFCFPHHCLTDFWVRPRAAKSTFTKIFQLSRGASNNTFTNDTRVHQWASNRTITNVFRSTPGTPKISEFTTGQSTLHSLAISKSIIEASEITGSTTGQPSGHSPNFSEFIPGTPNILCPP